MTNDAQPLTITAAAPLIRSGELTPSELLEQCLARVDQYEPKVRAWVHLDRGRARREADQLTAEVKAGHYRGPLHGIPIGIKDIIDVFDMPTGCGSKLWANSYARRDATCVERLRQAGALILGKTVTTAYAYLDPPVTRNPWNLDRTPGGSSSGSAAAVACGMCLASLGSQTGGSTTRPASYCGVSSLKPTYGRISLGGVLPLASRLDHIGVMANCVRDLAVVLEAIAGPSESRGRCSANLEPIPDCTAGIDRREWAHTLLRLGGMFDDRLSPDAAKLYDLAVTRLEEEWAPIDRVVPPAAFAGLMAAHKTVMSVEAAVAHDDRPQRHPEDYPPKIRALIQEGEAGYGPAYSKATELRDELEVDLNEALSGQQFFLTPAATSLPPTPETTGDPSFAVPWSFTGLPTVSVPCGWSSDGLPFAVQLVGRIHDEARLLSAAAWCESVFALDRRLPPVPG